MKLLPRKQLDVQVAFEKKQQIDEGVKIASRIDVLRQTLASLEVQHKEFLGGMQAELKRTTQGLIDGIAAKKKELVELQAEIEKKRIPLDAEKAELVQERKIVSSLKVDYDKKIKEVSLKESQLSAKNTKANTSLSNIKVRERELIKFYDKIAKLEQSTQVINKKAADEKEEQDRLLEEARSRLRTREAKCKSDMQSVLNLQGLLLLKETELDNRDKAITDRYETLQRTINRTQQ